MTGAVVIVAYNDVTHLRTALESCARYAPEVPAIVVDNASRDGSASMVRTAHPQVRLIELERNRGFGGGCNAGIEAARELGAGWVLLLNQDAELTGDAVRQLAAFLRDTPRAAAVQPAILRPDGRCNSLGNPVQFLGFSYAGGNGETIAEARRDPALPWLAGDDWLHGVEVPVVSGAAVMLRMAALDDVGGFEEELFLYHEDFELSLRLRERGWSLHLLGAARVVHDYSFRRNRDKWYHLERNRHWVLAVHYQRETLAVLVPALAAAELAVWLQAARQGWLGEKLASYRYWLNPRNRAYARLRRRTVQQRRTVPDAELLACATPFMHSGDEPQRDGRSSASERILALTWRVLRSLIR